MERRSGNTLIIIIIIIIKVACFKLEACSDEKQFHDRVVVVGGGRGRGRGSCPAEKKCLGSLSS